MESSLLAELNVRHTRRHMPTRRVALDGAYLPTSGPAHGAALLAAVTAVNLPLVADEQRELLPKLLNDAKRGLTIPRIALRHRLPSIGNLRRSAEAGFLMGYGPDISDMFRISADYVDKILRGAKPADLPVQQPTKFELVVNLKTAKALGLTIPPAILARADEVIE